MIYKGKYKVTQPYRGKDHQGIDLVGVDSKEIVSPISGTVVASRFDNYPDGGMGLYVKIIDQKNRRHLFAHLKKSFVSVGEKVDIGTAIGIEGNTGYSFGSHCHYEIRQTDKSGSFLNVSEIMSIPNALGIYGGIYMTKEEAKKIVKAKAGLSDSTIQYIADDYRYGDDLIIKLAKAMEGK